MQAKTSTYARPWGKPEPLPIPSFRLIRSIRRWRHFIETSAWEERFLEQERRLDILCWVCVAASLIFFIPVCFRALAG